MTAIKTNCGRVSKNLKSAKVICKAQTKRESVKITTFFEKNKKKIIHHFGGVMYLYTGKSYVDLEMDHYMEDAWIKQDQAMKEAPPFFNQQKRKLFEVYIGKNEAANCACIRRKYF